MTNVQSGAHDASRNSGNDPQGGRTICDALRLFRICPQAGCRRTQACRGMGELCIRRHRQIVPKEVWAWVTAMLDARDDGLSHEEIMAEIEPLEGAYFGWIAGVEAGLGARRATTRERA